MRVHIQETIRELSGEIAKLQDAIITLHKFEGTVTEVPGNGAVPAVLVVEGKTEISNLRSQKRAPKKPTRKTSALADYVRRGGVEEKPKAGNNGLNQALMELLPQLPAQFDQGMVKAHVGEAFDLNQVRGGLSYLKKIGKLITVEEGRPGHPAKFRLMRPSRGNAGLHPVKPLPAEAGVPGRIKIPGLDQEEQSISDQIEEACHKRDAERAGGRENMAKMYQDKVDKLQAQL